MLLLKNDKNSKNHFTLDHSVQASGFGYFWIFQFFWDYKWLLVHIKYLLITKLDSWRIYLFVTVSERCRHKSIVIIDESNIMIDKSFLCVEVWAIYTLYVVCTGRGHGLNYIA